VTLCHTTDVIEDISNANCSLDLSWALVCHTELKLSPSFDNHNPFGLAEFSRMFAQIIEKNFQSKIFRDKIEWGREQ